MEITNPKKFPHTTMRCLTASCEPFQKRVTGRFGDGRIFPPMKLKQFKVEYSFFLKSKCRKHYFRISIMNALQVNGHPTAIAVDGRTSFPANVNGP